MSRYLDFISRAKKAHGDKFDDSGLSGQFIIPFENDNRIEVCFRSGGTKRGRVGITTGWKPVFILLLTRRSIGSAWILDNTCFIKKIIE